MNIQDTIVDGSPQSDRSRVRDRSAAEGQSVHWADLVADKIVRFKTTDGKPKASYTCASGGHTVGDRAYRQFPRDPHFCGTRGSRFARAGRKESGLFTGWDDYDVFRESAEKTCPTRMFSQLICAGP